MQGGAGCQHLQRQGSCGLPTVLGDATAWPQTALLGFAILVTFPWGDTSTLTRVWLWALLSTTRMNMEICIISTLAAPVRNLGGEADSSRSSPCWPLALALLVALEHSTLLPATGQCTGASHASQDPHGPMGTTTCGGLEGPPGPATLLRRQKQRQAPPWSCCLEQGHPVALWHGQASCLGPSAAPPSPSNKVPYVGRGPGPSMYEPRAGWRPCPKLSLARTWQDHHDLSSRQMAQT